MVIAVVVFAATAVAILFLGPRMADVAQRLATLTGIGGALFGVLFLAIATGLPEIALTPAAVLQGRPNLAIGNLLGAASVQVVAIAVADLAYRRGNLTRDASSPSAIGQSGLLLGLVALPLIAAPLRLTIGWFSIITPLLVVAYLAGVMSVKDLAQHPDPDREARDLDLRSLWLRFALYAALLAGGGVVLERATSVISSGIGLSATAGGALLAAVATSLPEIATVVAAVRRGALSLAVGDAVGSSAFDLFLLGWADAFHTNGSIFALIGSQEMSLVGLLLAVASLTLLGLVRREPPGVKQASVESYLMLAAYAAVAVLLVTTG